MATTYPPPSVKTYNVFRSSTWNYRRLEIQVNGQTFLWVNTVVKFLSAPVINLHHGSEAGTIVASAKAVTFSNNLDIMIAPQAGAQKFTQVQGKTFGTSSYRFADAETHHEYEWRRTHRKELGSSRLSNSDYKLVDPTNGDKILAVYVKDSFMGGRGVAHIDFMFELGVDLELEALASILKIEDSLRRSRNNSSAASAA